MSAKFGPRRKAAFLKDLAFCGNQTLAAERVAVSRSWVGLQRATDAAFDAAVRGAIAVAKERLRARSLDTLGTNGGDETGPPLAPPASGRGKDARPPSWGRGSSRPPAGWGFLDGAELVVRGSGGSGGGRRVQIGRARAHQWTARVEARFLAALAATCNVKAACAEVGMHAPSAYAHRKRWRAFAAAWDAAIDEGYARIEIALLERGCNLFSDPEEIGPIDDQPIAAMTVAEAIHLLHMHKHQVHALGKPPGKSWRTPRTLDEVRDSILRKLEAIERAEAIPPEQRAADEAAFAARRWRGGDG